MHTAIAIVRSLTVDCFGVAAELDARLKLEVELKLEVGLNLDVGLNFDMGLNLDVGLNSDMGLNPGLDLEAGLKLDMGLELGAERGLRLPITESMTNEEVIKRVAVDNCMVVVGEEAGKYDDCAMRRVGSRENRFIALTPEQQEPLSKKSVVVSQHIGPEAHSSEQDHTVAPLLLKSSASAPVYSSVFQVDRC